MEQSDKSAKPPACKGAEAAPSKPAELSIESVGWLFVKKYYSTYATGVDSLYSFYDKNASLLHDKFPASGDDEASKKAKTVHVASGHAAIKTHYDAQATSTDKSKIVIESAEFQESVEGAILIVVCGSWKRGASKLWQFVQTFVLSAKGKTVFDISNDVLKFFDLAEDYQEKSVFVERIEAKQALAALAAPAEEAKPDSAPETAAEPAETKSEERKPCKDDVVADALFKTEEQPEPAPALPVETQDSTAPKTEPVPAGEPEKTAVPPKKQTWATLAAIEPKTASKIAFVPASTTVVKPPPTIVKAASPALLMHVNGSKFRKEEWYPIYIKNIEVSDEDMQGALIKQFGDIKFYKRNNKAALCDFKNKADQQKALEAKEIDVKGNHILLEPRVHKTFNNYKPEGKKDKKPMKKSGIKKT
ncbi:NTF2-like protein [Metschnikowia bicuspidata]|uniref:NTF2-like protein n=1 Tax=Metschnikowia bicuspidata TaxID=27322 RepID=A0A4P9Z9R8_9ASCO|nr:NTF2-like protein [Metschnikowia bicuspidata]